MASEASCSRQVPDTAYRRPARRSRAIRVITALACGVWLLACASAERAVSQDVVSGGVADRGEKNGQESTPQSLDYVTILCPEAWEEEWRPGGASYRRVAQGDFFEMLRSAYPGRPPSIRSASYEARLDGDELVDGRALLAIGYLGPIKATLPLDPCNLAIERAGWADRDGEFAQAGLGPNGEFALRVDRGGTLDAAWSLKGAREAREAVSFRIELPPCSSSRFLLTVPEDRIPFLFTLPEDPNTSIPTGVVSRQGTPEDGMQSWQMELGGENRFLLRIAPQDDPEGHRQTTELRQESVYRMSPGGLEATFTLHFDVLGQPLRRLELLVAPELNVLSVQEGDNAIPWGEEALPEMPTKRIFVEPELPLFGLGRELTLTALMPIQLAVPDTSRPAPELGEMDAPTRDATEDSQGMSSALAHASGERRDDEELSVPLRLPALTVSGVRWCDSAASVIVQHPLRLRDVKSDQGRIVRGRSKFARRTVDAVDLQLFADNAQIDVVLGQEQTPPQVDYGVLVEMGGGQITARQKVRLDADEGEHFQVVGELARSWVIDSVDPAGAIADWRIDRKRRGKRQLVIDLAQSLANDAPVELDIAARRLESTAGRRYSSREMIPVEFTSCRPDTALVALQPMEQYQIDLSGTQSLVQRETQNLSHEERQLFPETPRGRIYLHDGGDEGLSIKVKQRRSLYSAEIDVSVSVSGKQATESYVFRIHPESVRLENVAVELLKRPGASLRWEPSTGGETHLEPESPDAQDEGRSRLERWNVSLRPSRSEAFEMRARRVFTIEDETAIGLARLPDATRQTGRVSIGVSGGEDVRVVNRSLTPELSAPPHNPSEIPRSVYRYDPRRSLFSGSPPIVLRADSSPSTLPKAWIWLCQIESRLEPTGIGRHVASYRVESVGAPILRLSLPAAIGMDMIESVEIDGRRAPLEAAPMDSPANLALRLHRDRRFHEVTVCYRTAGARWSALHPLRIPVPEPDLPVLKRNWIVWVPPGRQVIETKGVFRPSNAPDRWPACVLGPMVRGASRGPLDPFVADSWKWLSALGLRQAHAPSSSLGENLSDSAARNWGDLLALDDISDVWSEWLPENGDLSFLVDVKAVAKQEISPNTGVTLPDGGGSTDQFRLVLKQAGLALAVSGNHVVLTSVSRATARGERLSRGAGVLWRVTDTAWAEELEHAVAEASPTLVAASEWLKLPSAPEAPWTTTHRPGYEPRDTAGWSVYEIDLTDPAMTTALVVDRNLLHSGLWLFFLLVAFLTWTVAVRYPALAFFPIVGFLLAAAYLPDFWSPWLSAGFRGGCVGLLIRMVTVRRPRSAGRVVAARRVGNSTAVVGIVCLLTLVSASNGAAQSTEASESPKGPALVLAPVGEDYQPTGNDYSVPEDFFMDLQRQAQQIAEEAPEWLLKDAYYHGSLSWQATGEPLTVTEFTAEYGLEVVNADKPVKIPFGSMFEDWSLEAVWLDGRSLDQDDIVDGNLVFKAELSESSQLRLRLRPIPGRGMKLGGCELDIPRLAASRLELTIPAGAPRVEVPTATGRTRRQPLKLEADLGPTDRLVVRWQPTGRVGSNMVTRVEELLWLNLAPGEAKVETQFRFELGQDFQSELHLVHDLRLRQPDSYEVEGATLNRVESIEDSNLMRQKLFLTRGQGTEVIVRGEFEFHDASGIGSVSLPELRSDGVEVSRRWAAATVAPMLLYEQSVFGTSEKIGLSEFVEVWGGEVDLPSVAFRLDSSEASFGLTTRPKSPRSSAQWEMDLRYELRETGFEYRANVDTTEGYLFCHRLAVPPTLEIAEVTATVSDVPRTVRWTRPASERIVLFFDVPVSGQHTIRVRGNAPAKGRRSEPLQLIELQDVECEPGEIDVYREPAAIVALESVEGMTKTAERLGQIVTRWKVDGEGPPTALARVEPNEPKVVAHEQIISLRQTPEGWVVDVECELEVVNGIADRILMETSELWPGPYQVSSGVTEESLRGERGELVLLPPPRDRFAFRVSGPLVPTAGGRTSVPRIRMRKVEYSEKSERLVVLPVGPAPAIHWDVLGLTLTDVPSQFVAEAPGLAWMAYEVRRDDFLATIRPTPDAAQVHLADIRLAWEANGECRGVAIFDLEAGDRDSCVLRLPPPWRLMSASNHGVPISPRVKEDGSWTIPLNRTVLPQRLELVFGGLVSFGDHGTASIEAFPELVDLPVMRTLWTVAGSGEFEVVGAGKPIRRELLAMERLRNVTALIHPANHRPGSSVAEDESWYRGWLGDWVDARREAELAVAFADRATSVPAEQAELKKLDADQQAFAEQFHAADLWGSLMASPASRVTPSTLWDHSQLGVAQKYYLANEDSFPSVLRIDLSGKKQHSRLAMSPLLYVAAVLLVLLAGWATGRLHRWPHLFGVVLGLCWWLWFWPSFIGLLLIAVCLTAAVRSGWRRPRSSGSAIVQLSVSGRS
jgi:hypothetical protein